MNSPTILRAGGVSLALAVVGQSILVALGPLTRAARADGGAAGLAGVALLSSDSEYYLQLASSPTVLGKSPTTRVAFPLILRLGSALGSAPTFAVVVNFIAIVIAGMLLYDLGRRFGGSSAAGTLATASLVVNPLTAQWVRFVLTETLSYAAVVGALWTVVNYSAKPSLKAFALIVATGGFAALLRPNGALILAGSIAGILILLGGQAAVGRLRQILLHSLIWAAAFAFSFIGSGDPDPRLPAASDVIVSLLYGGVIVEGTPEVLVTTPMPAPADASDLSLGGAVEYALRHPVAVAKLGILRIAYETLQLRPHYPVVVNLVMGIGFAAFVLFVLVGIRAERSRVLRTAVVMLAIPQVLLVAATFAVPESRYGWTYLVTLCTWAGIGADRILRRALPRTRRAGSV